MSIVSGEADGGEMTLAFSLPAVRRLADPAAAFEDARSWSRHVGIVDDDRVAIAALVDEYDLQQDYDLGDRDKWLALSEITEETDSPRYVYIGWEIDDRRVADHLDWEFIHLQEAAEKAGWPVGTQDDSEPVLGRLRRLVPFLS